MRDSYVFSLIVTFVISISFLVAWIFLLHNVSQIKRKIAPNKEDIYYRVNILMALGRKEEARQLVIDRLMQMRDTRISGPMSQAKKTLGNETVKVLLSIVDLTVDEEVFKD